MYQRKIYDRQLGTEPDSFNEPAGTTSRSELPERELEMRVHDRSQELADLIARVREPARSLAAHDAMHAIRERVGEQPERALLVEPGRQNFLVFGLLLLVVGLAMSVFPPLAMFGVPFALLGAGIALVGLVVCAFRGREKRRRQDDVQQNSVHDRKAA